MAIGKAPVTPISGFIVAPNGVTALGGVLFVDQQGNQVTPNQVECEAYGYTYNSDSNTCSIFRYNTNLNRVFDNLSNSISGAGNTTETGVGNTQIIGESNTVRNLSRNIGSISDSTDATTFISRRKTSVIELSGVTIDNTSTNLTVQGGDSFINVEKNSIIGYDIYITRLELGGTSGTAGNYSYRNIRGAVKIDDSLTMSFVVGITRNIAKIGVNGTCIMADSTTGGVPSISVNVTDRNNVNNLWSASVTLHEVVSTTTF